jgi:hypothetical protein
MRSRRVLTTPDGHLPQLSDGRTAMTDIFLAQLQVESPLPSQGVDVAHARRLALKVETVAS